jgi:hypothetical protein
VLWGERGIVVVVIIIIVIIVIIVSGVDAKMAKDIHDRMLKMWVVCKDITPVVVVHCRALELSG